MAKSNPYSMTLSLNVLNHLGIDLYGRMPAGLSEVVANSWDAAPEMLEFRLNPDKKAILITDNGHGMTQKHVNEKFLLVGYGRSDRPNHPGHLGQNET